MSIFSPQLNTRFDELLKRYPVPRSAMVPMLLYAQDELGYLTPEAIREIAARLDESELAVHEVIGYYSMLRTKPAGRF
ncbi:MAG: NADH-quinone oxidoreductase subunit NuoE family protein, partial [Terriglobales bacterium]